jgi:hypothetical protein
MTEEKIKEIFDKHYSFHPAKAVICSLTLSEFQEAALEVRNETLKELNIPKAYTPEFVNFLLVNAIRGLTKEQFETLTQAMFERCEAYRIKIRNEILEEAAKVCEERLKHSSKPSFAVNEAIKQCAEAIRKLKNQ